jgi:hypothetical protein
VSTRAQDTMSHQGDQEVSLWRTLRRSRKRLLLSAIFVVAAGCTTTYPQVARQLHDECDGGKPASCSDYGRIQEACAGWGSAFGDTAAILLCPWTGLCGAMANCSTALDSVREVQTQGTTQSSPAAQQSEDKKQQPSVQTAPLLNIRLRE